MRKHLVLTYCCRRFDRDKGS